MFDSKCKDEQFQIYGENNGRGIKSGDKVALLVSHGHIGQWFDISLSGDDGMYVKSKKRQLINLDGTFTSRTGKKVQEGVRLYD